MKIMTINIRFDNPLDNITWNKRKLALIEMIEKHDPDLIGFQEVTPSQLEYLLEKIGDIYDYYGFYRDKLPSSEMNPIFFKKSKFELVDNEALWLSENPKVKNQKGWDADLARVVTVVKLKSLLESKEFIFLNTHFDHIGKIARSKSSQLILELIDKYNDQNLPVIVTGDFNTRPEDGYIDDLLHSKKLANSYSLLEDKKHSLTIHDFTGQTEGSPIDHIFIQNTIHVKSCEIVRFEEDGVYPSDHWHVMCQVEDF